MITKINVYAPMAVAQVIYKFNSEHNTSIEKTNTEYLDGSSFVEIDFKDTPSDLTFHFGYLLGRLQKHLANKRESLLPLEDYPFPPEE